MLRIGKQTVKLEEGWGGGGLGSRSGVVPSGFPNLDTISEQYVDINLSGFATEISLICLLTKRGNYFFIRLLLFISSVPDRLQYINFDEFLSGN